jgi:hypothetical protein
MSDYKIKKLQKDKAKKLNVEIKPSTNKKKKVDVFKDGKKVGSVGASGYKDYATYVDDIGLKEANKKRKNYLKRHSKEPKSKDGNKTNSYWADKILW